MPLARYTLKPGINKEGTSYSNEGSWFDCDKIRFRQGRPEKIGGWSKTSINSYLGSGRKLHQWVALDSDQFVGLGTHLKLYLKQGDVLIFPADYHWVHEVKPITKGTRYSVNCFLLDVPESVREELQLKKDELMEKYKFNPDDGIRYNINTEPN